MGGYFHREPGALLGPDDIQRKLLLHPARTEARRSLLRLMCGIEQDKCPDLLHMDAASASAG